MSVFEVKKDFTSEVATLLPESDLICEQRNIDEAITLLFTIEKKCRIHYGNFVKFMKLKCYESIRHYKLNRSLLAHASSL